MLYAAGCTGTGGGDDDEVGTTTTTVVRSTAAEAPLEVGQCGDVPRIGVGGPVDPATFDERPCDEPHGLEVAAVFDHPAAAGAGFPGEAAVDGHAVDDCLRRFEAYVGAAYEASSLDVIFVAPGEAGWRRGDRRIACLVYDSDFAPLSGSVRGAGR